MKHTREALRILIEAETASNTLAAEDLRSVAKWHVELASLISSEMLSFIERVSRSSEVSDALRSSAFKLLVKAGGK